MAEDTTKKTTKKTTRKTTTKKTSQSNKNSDTKLNLPKYLRLAKGAMWFDTDGEKSSGVKLYCVDKVFVGKKVVKEKEGKSKDERERERIHIKAHSENPKDKFGNENIVEYGYVDNNDLKWYVDTTEIPKENISRILMAYKHGVLVEADPNNPPVKPQGKQIEKSFVNNKEGDLVFNGTNKKIFGLLMNSDDKKLKDFISNAPKTRRTQKDFIDLIDYEKRGLNLFSSPRGDVIDLVRERLNEFGSGISGITVNEKEDSK